MQRRLVTELPLQPLLAQFVSVHIDSNSEAWQAWERKFPSKSDSIPIVYMIRADGESLYAQSGSLPGAELGLLLAQTLAKSGKILSDVQLKKMSEGVAAAGKAHEAGNIAGAVLGVTRLAGSGSYAEAALAADALANKLAQEALQKIKAADEKLQSESTALEGAVELAAVNRLYKKLPGIIKAVKETSAKRTLDAASRERFAQAEQLDRAKAYEDERQAAKAARIYEQVREKYPDGPAAELARSRLDALGPAATAADKSPGGDKAVGSQDLKKAASLLKMAKVLAKGKPDKAKQYAEQILELAPDSEQAQEAKSLIESLGGK